LLAGPCHDPPVHWAVRQLRDGAAVNCWRVAAQSGTAGDRPRQTLERIPVFQAARAVFGLERRAARIFEGVVEHAAAVVVDEAFRRCTLGQTIGATSKHE
jgi:hypothetical protein